MSPRRPQRIAGLVGAARVSGEREHSGAALRQVTSESPKGVKEHSVAVTT